MKHCIEDLFSIALIICCVLIPLLVASLSGLIFEEVQVVVAIGYGVLFAVGFIYYTIVLAITK